MSERPQPRGLASAGLAALVFLLASGCAAYRTARVIDLRDVPESERVRRVDERTPPPLFVDTTAAIVVKGTIETAISVAPPLEDYLRAELEAALDAEVEDVRIDLLDYRYAYYFPSRADDLVLEVTLVAPAAGLEGSFEARFRGKEKIYRLDLLEGDPPDTGAGLGEEEPKRRLERRGDQIAWEHRAKLREIVRRLVESVATD